MARTLAVRAMTPAVHTMIPAIHARVSRRPREPRQSPRDPLHGREQDRGDGEIIGETGADGSDIK
ncbi:hypothetical protein ACQPYK_14530 [Streptosporangium sp. CA-135522]|uniref:hypothetical protein n=1 Tax=Streptosporangium sp. CA-135522 TaxID=3240072 RepID=UPI003D94951D